jgi:TolB-like protein/DNA-binding winged helix-turn-helix (wHTH) protein/Tfp pilus assembly protein PilF
MAKEDKQLYEFGPFRVDPEQRLLFRGQEPVPLPPKAFETLLILVERSERVVLKDDLMKSLWPDTFVEEANLSQNIFLLRKALGETAQDARYIVTVPGRGYRFAEKVKQVADEEDAAAMESRSQPQGMEESSLSPVSTPGRDGRRVRAVGLALGAALLLVAGFLAWRALRPPARATAGRRMLAVLPFQNLTGDPEQEYFADGLTEELITKLGRLNPAQLGVIARTSVMGYKHTDKRLDQIGRELGVQYVLEGSVRRAGDRVRITAQLISVTDQSHLWSDDYDRKVQDVITVQDDVAIAVADQTQLKLDAAQQSDLARGRTVNPEAYEAYLRGRFFWNKRTEAGFRKSIEYFETAIAKDPSFAQAHSGLADSYVLLGGYGFEAQEAAMPRAKAAALKALGIDDRLADAYTSLALISLQYEWNWKESEKDYKRAIELNPNYSVAHHWYGDGYLAAVGRTDEAIAELRQAQELDPLSLVIGTDLAKRLCLAGKYEEGMERFRKILEIDPDFVQAHYHLSEVYELRGEYPKAIAEVEKIRSPDAVRFVTGQLGYIYARQGRKREALEVVDELQRSSKQTYIDPRYVANIYVALGEKDLALAWLEKAYEQHSPAMLGLKTDPSYDPIRSDARFMDLMRRVGLPP